MAIRSPAARRALALVLLALPARLLTSAPPESARPGEGEDKPVAPKKLRLYVGTYTGPKSKGIYRLDFDSATGKLSGRALAAKAANPSFLAIHPTRRFLYAVNETSDLDGKKTGAVAAFAVDRKTGDLKFLNRRPSRGAGPCHLVVDAGGKHVLAANYGGGSACVLPVGKDGKLGEATGFVQHKGSGVNPDRQEGPHAHSINLDRANSFAFVADLGLDRVMVYKYDARKGTLTANDPAFVKVKPGSGPRHFAFHPSGRFAYVINELANTVTAFRYHAGEGRLETLQMVTTLPKGFKGKSYTAEVVVHPSGKFLYGSNRGHDSIAVFRVDTRSGKLTPAGHQGAGVKTPRNFTADPAGRFLLVANQDADSVVVFSIDPRTGALSPTGHSAEVPAPVCLRLTAAPEGK